MITLHALNRYVPHIEEREMSEKYGEKVVMDGVEDDDKAKLALQLQRDHVTALRSPSSRSPRVSMLEVSYSLYSSLIDYQKHSGFFYIYNYSNHLFIVQPPTIRH